MVEMLSYTLMQKVSLATLLISVIVSMLSVFLIIRRQSLMTDIPSHVSLVGVTLGFFSNWSPNLIVLIVVVVAIIVLEYLRMACSTCSEISIAILTSGGLALALILMDLVGGNSTANIQSYLFGSIITITWDQVVTLVTLSVVLALLFMLFGRPMYVLTFDKDATRVDGLSVHQVLMPSSVVTSVTVAVMIPIMGILLILAIVVLPVAIDMRIGKGFNVVTIISVLVGLIDILTGLVGSYYLGTPSSTSITLILTGLSLLTSTCRRMAAMIQ